MRPPPPPGPAPRDASAAGRAGRYGWRRRGATAFAAAIATLAAGGAQAQFSALKGGQKEPVNKDAPVFYQADSAEYDRDSGIVTLTGHVDIWQGKRDLRADKVTYDRNTGVAAASGHVVMIDADGQVAFADYAELSEGMKEGVARNLRAQLAENGRLAANGARRTDANINELSRVIYSTCNVCKEHPDRPALWDIRARSAVQDVANKRIEYKDAVLDIYGFPIAYAPYFTHPDPSAKRASGFLVPSLGLSKYLGGFFELPYYWVIDDSTDATLTPILATKTGPALDVQARHQFNDGTVTVNASIARDQNALQGDVFAKGQFAIDDEWRWGFDLERASSAEYMRDFAINGEPELLTSTLYLEGFGQGSYSKVSLLAYQSLAGNIIPAQLPYVLPRYEYSFVGQPDALGGRFSLDVSPFNVVRQSGTDTQRLGARLDWERPATGALGDLWKLVLHVDGAVYNAQQLDKIPTWGPVNGASSAQAMPSAALDLNWPLRRSAGDWGTQVIEPIAQLIAAPRASSYATKVNAHGTPYVDTLIPNEDSYDFQFTDANLFSLNRFPGIDRFEGGVRANVALHGAWYFPGGQTLDALVGQAYRLQPDDAFPVGSGIRDTVSDIVGHISYTPNQWFDFTAHERFDHNTFNIRYLDAVASGGPSWLRMTAGYFYSPYNPYYYYDYVPTDTLVNNPRNEVSFGASTTYGRWRLNAVARTNVATGQMVSLGAGGAFENECFIFDVNFYRRYTSLNGDNGASTVLFNITFKTVGTFGFHAL